jgi:hypothetical protein
VKLQVGNAYRITATPKPGNILLRWDNSTGDSELPYRPTQGNYEYYFVMQSNLVLTATFVTNPIVAANAKGPYNGLFYETNASGAPAIAEQSAGAILNLNVQPNSSYSATIVCAGGKYTFKGAFIGPVASSYDYKVISRANIFKGPLRVLLNPDWTNHKITGQVNCGEEGWVSPLLLEASAYSVNHALSSVTQYTMAIAPAADAPVNSPGGYGYGTLKVTAQGLLQLNGALADGASPLTEAVQVASDGNWPLYCDLYNHTGLIAGWISLSGGAPSGQLTWIKPPGIGLYPNGFSNVVSAFGSLYTPRSPAINLAPGTLDVTDGSGLNLPQTFNVALSGNNTLANANGTSNSVTGTITTSSGLITVNFRPTGVGAITKTAKGVVLQSSNAACGAFIGNNDGTGKTNTGAIYLH